MEIERIARLEEQGKWIASKIDKIDQKVDLLIAFKWKVIGMAAAAAFLATTLVEIARAMGVSK